MKKSLFPILLFGVGILFFMPKAGAREDYTSLFRETEALNRLPFGLLERVAKQESGFRPDVISGKVKSSAGAVGIMQIMPKQHPNVNPYNPRASIKYAGKYLHDLYKEFGTWEYALAAYNWGPGNLRRNLREHILFPSYYWPGETKRYTSEILSDVEV